MKPLALTPETRRAIRAIKKSIACTKRKLRRMMAKRKVAKDDERA